MSTCQNCGETKHVYYAGGWCAACGWHSRGETLAHANFSPDSTGCEWCAMYKQESHGREQ